MNIVLQTTRAQWRDCHSLFLHLRPHLDEATFLAQVARQAVQGFRMVAVEREGAKLGAAGFRCVEHLAWGRVLYIDDLITDPVQTRKGVAGALLDWLIAHARDVGCDQLHLDTGYQRTAAHRLYLRKGLQLHCHHLAMPLH